MTDEELNKRMELKKKIEEVLDPFLLKEVREAIVKLVIDHVEENGSCRAGWAAENIIGKKQQNHVHDKIAGLVTRWGKYIKERNEHFPQDWTIYRNPNYEFAEISKKTSIVQRWALFITIGISAITLIISWLNYRQSKFNQATQKGLQEQINNLNPTIKIDTVIVNQQLPPK
ncbi:MAG: hypothetical protein ACRDEB_03925 [Chitinophagaceae bacterium]